MRNILAFGAVLWDIIGEKEFIGGAPLNFSAHIKHLGCDVAFVSRVGDDARGNLSRACIRSFGLNDSLIQTDTIHPTGIALVELSSSGSPSFELPINVAYDFIEFDLALKASLNKEYDAVYFGTLEQRSPVTSATLDMVLSNIRAKHVFYDINLRLSYYSKKIIEWSLKQATIVKMNDDEVYVVSKLLYEDEYSLEQFYNKLLHDFNVEVLCITKGKDGCEVFSENKKVVQPGISVEVVDTIGAGDAFSAAFVNEYLTSGDIDAAAKAGNEMGALVASKKGAVPCRI